MRTTVRARCGLTAWTAKRGVDAERHCCALNTLDILRRTFMGAGLWDLGTDDRERQKAYPDHRGETKSGFDHALRARAFGRRYRSDVSVPSMSAVDWRLPVRQEPFYRFRSSLLQK